MSCKLMNDRAQVSNAAPVLKIDVIMMQFCDDGSIAVAMEVLVESVPEASRVPLRTAFLKPQKWPPQKPYY